MANTSDSSSGFAFMSVGFELCADSTQLLLDLVQKKIKALGGRLPVDLRSPHVESWRAEFALASSTANQPDKNKNTDVVKPAFQQVQPVESSGNLSQLRDKQIHPMTSTSGEGTAASVDEAN